MDILVTGGAGYIGSHTVIELVAAGFNPVVADNLSNSKAESLRRVAELCGQDITFYQADIQDAAVLADIFSKHDFSAVIHFAGLKAVGESCERPLNYYQTNVAGTMSLLELMAENRVHNFIFSSSATVYGDPDVVPIPESALTRTTNPYGASKLMVEDICRDLCRAPNNPFKISLLRYFNPIGAHPSGRIGEDPNGIPNNLLPYISQVAVGKLPRLQVFGDDYPTVDGTGVRDYIHVLDLAKGHVAALQYLLNKPANCYTFNLGTGQGYSVLDVVNAFTQASGKAVPYDIAPRRSGDIAACYADADLAKRELGWEAEHSIEQMVSDAWRWQSANPNGYE
ncbi:UDP-glucose 4-epimerase GalE [Pseudoteredinibacter isoporae]|uniref:UDP-glucose 4-epimerase GalE n=1 Tax=Pseudoteredinibacter isoporae TaxID=570281 RepID=UPI00310880A4